MAVAQDNMNRAVSSDATFRTEAQRLSTLITTCGGLVNTADTGQINFTTVTKPVAINTAAGYQIWRFDDALQATFPVYIKLEYGSSGVASGNSIGYWITVGTGTDGAGTLTGQITVRTQLSSSTTAGSGTPTLFVSADTRRLFFYWSQSTSVNYWCAIERAREADGSLTADTALAFCSVVTGASVLSVLPKTGAVPGQVVNFHAFVPVIAEQPGEVSGTDYAIAPLAFAWQGRWMHPLAFVWGLGQLTAGTPTALTYLGASRTFLPVSGATASWGSGSTNTFGAFGYE